VIKRSLILCLSILIAGSSVAADEAKYDQDTTIRPGRLQGPGNSFLGVELGEVTAETVQRLKLREERGALINSVTDGSGAAQAGLQKNDVIVKWDGEPIESARELSRQIRETPAGRTVRLGVIRDGREIEVSVKLGERASLITRPRVARPVVARPRIRPQVQLAPRARVRGRLGVELQSMTAQLAEYFGLSKRTGALVVFVFADSPAAKAGLKAGDVILSAGGETVESPMDLRRVLTGKPEGVIDFKIIRDKREQTVTVQVEKGTSSWLLEDGDLGDQAIRAVTTPMVIDVPGISVTPMVIQTPRINIAPMAIAVPKIAIAPMNVDMPKIRIAPIAIPPAKVDLTPMTVELPKIKIPRFKYVVSPRRMWL